MWREKGEEIDGLMLKRKRLMKRRVYTIPGTEWRVLGVEIGGNLKNDQWRCDAHYHKEENGGKVGWRKLERYVFYVRDLYHSWEIVQATRKRVEIDEQKIGGDRDRSEKRLSKSSGEERIWKMG